MTTAGPDRDTQRTRRTPTGVIPALVVVIAALVVAVVMLVMRPTPAVSAPPVDSTTVATTEETAQETITTTDTPDVTLAPSAVDSVIAKDGVPLDLSSDAVGEPYADAYAMVEDDCNTMATLQNAQTPSQWLTGHLLNESISGEFAALKIGIPLVCPQFDNEVLQAELSLSTGQAPH